MEQLFFVIGMAGGGTLLGILLIRWIFPKLGLLDRPEKYGYERLPIPYPAGIILPIIFSVLAAALLPLDRSLIGFLIAIWILVLVSFLDDRKNISPFIRLGVQLLIVLIVIFSGIGMTHVSNPFGGAFDLTQWVVPFEFFGTVYHFYVLADVFTCIWILVLINSMNWIDGISGLTSGIGAISGFVIASLAYVFLQYDIALLALGLGIACSVFWFFDFTPPKILMGDTGAMFLGFVIAVLAIFSSGKIATAFLVLGVPLFDAVRTIFRRIREKKSIFRGDLEHYHHCLLKGGLSERWSACIIYIITLFFGISALALGSLGKMWAIILLGVTLAIILFVLDTKNKKRKKV